MPSGVLNRSDVIVLAGSAVAVALAGVTRYAHAGAVVLLEGATLLGLYVIIATVFWWG